MKNKFLYKTFLAVSVAIFLLSGCKTKGTEEKKNISEKPNIIYILADDAGYGDIGALGQEKIETPNIDRLISEGMLFTEHYSGSTVCAPSRSALLTGQHTGHTAVRGNLELQPEGQYPLPNDRKSIAQVLKDAGYKTGAFGKWGLGFIGTTGDPVNQGFDEFYGYNCQRMAHRYYPNHIWHNDKKVILEGNGWENTEVYAQDLIQEKTLDFIDKNQEDPFFLFVPAVLPHAELIVPEDSLFNKYLGEFPDKPFVNKRKGSDYGSENFEIILYTSQEYPLTTYAAMMSRLDVYVGQIMDKVEELGLAENTIIMFSSDNGPHQEGGNDPDFFNSNNGFRGYKRDLYDGGIHVPFAVSWPGVVKEGSRTDHISAFWDVLPTFCDIVDSDIPENTDGISFLPTLLGNPGEQKEHDYLYWEFHERGGRQAIRMGKWKAVRYNVFKGNRPIELYDLSVDPREQNNLAGDHPEIIKKVKEIFEKARTESDIFKFQAKTVAGD
ncbi:arylsulfatase [Marinilabilia rubra]|uniref:Arylsulfatase n=1 Tax=Marinilabilia rubra TaxID=2162893 RepID=A0A2U2BE94_9BACT|nr:arylsulfatase [Marinilabilia rubra]PWE01381.1 arylsulfatase [Marinilabilia rubra]